MTNKNSGDVPGRVKTVTTATGVKIVQTLPGFKTRPKTSIQSHERKASY